MEFILTTKDEKKIKLFKLFLKALDLEFESREEEPHYELTPTELARKEFEDSIRMEFEKMIKKEFEEEESK